MGGKESFLQQVHMLPVRVLDSCSIRAYLLSCWWPGGLQSLSSWLCIFGAALLVRDMNTWAAMKCTGLGLLELYWIWFRICWLLSCNSCLISCWDMECLAIHWLYCIRGARWWKAGVNKFQLKAAWLSSSYLLQHKRCTIWHSSNLAAGQLLIGKTVSEQWCLYPNRLCRAAWYILRWDKVWHQMQCLPFSVAEQIQCCLISNNSNIDVLLVRYCL